VNSKDTYLLNDDPDDNWGVWLRDCLILG